MPAPIGFIERVVDGRLVGWGIQDPAQPGPSSFRLLVDGEAITEFASAIPRGDVSESGLPGDSAGFEIAIPRRFHDGQPHRVHVAFSSGHFLPFIGPDGTLAPNGVILLEPGLQVVGCLDGLQDTEIRGWALLVPPLSGLRRGGVAVTIRLDGQDVATLTATAPRPDVAAAWGIEACGFAFAPPRRFRDGGIHELRAYAAGEELPGSPTHFRFPPGAVEYDFQSCAPALYDAGSFHEPDHLLGYLRQAGPLEGTTDLGEVFPAFSYARPAPHLLHGPDPAKLAALSATFDRFETTTGPGAASHLVRLEDVFVQDNTIFRIVGDDVVRLYETARNIDRPYVRDREWTPARLRAAALQGSGTRPSLYLGGVGYINYGHWLIEDLPRAKVLDQIAEQGGGRPCIALAGTTPPLDSIKELSLRFLHPGFRGSDLLFIPPAEPVHFDTLFFVTPVAHHPVLKSPAAISLLRHRAARIRRTSATSPERIFVRRRTERGRVLLNADPVGALLARHGFAAVDPETMTFRDQAVLFAHARIVVGAMGAGMANTVFARPGTDLLYLAPDGWDEPFYWDLAACCGHRYSTLFGAREGSDLPPHQSAFHIDVGLLARTLDQLLADPPRPPPA